MNGVKGICLSFQVTPHGQGTNRAEDYRGYGPTPPGSGFDTPASISQKIGRNVYNNFIQYMIYPTCEHWSQNMPIKTPTKNQKFHIIQYQIRPFAKKMDRLICHSHVWLFFSKSREIAKPSLMNPVSQVARIVRRLAYFFKVASCFWPLLPGSSPGV